MHPSYVIPSTQAGGNRWQKNGKGVRATIRLHIPPNSAKRHSRMHATRRGKTQKRTVGAQTRGTVGKDINPGVQAGRRRYRRYRSYTNHRKVKVSYFTKPLPARGPAGGTAPTLDPWAFRMAGRSPKFFLLASLISTGPLESYCQPTGMQSVSVCQPLGMRPC